MKILILHNKLPYPQKDGGSIAVLNLAMSLAKLGHQINFLCFNTKKHYFNLNELPKDIKELIHFEDVNLNSDLNPFKLILNYIFSRKPFIATRFYNPKYKSSLKKLLTNDFDYILLEGLYMCQYIDFIRSNSNAKVIFRAHNVESEIWERIAFKEKNVFKKWYLNSLSKRLYNFEKNFINSYDYLVPISDRDKQSFELMGNVKPCKVIIPGIEVQKVNVQTINKSLFFIGALDWIPNQEGLIWFLENVWGTLKEKKKDVTLNVAGRNAPDWLVEKLSNSNGVIYHGEVESSAEFMMKHDIMLVPLFSGSGIRIKIIEAMAYGKAIVSTEIGAEGLHIQNKIHFLKADNENEFIDVLYELIHLKETEYAKLKMNAKGYFEDNFDNLASAKKLVDFLR